MPLDATGSNGINILVFGWKENRFIIQGLWWDDYAPEGEIKARQQVATAIAEEWKFDHIDVERFPVINDEAQVVHCAGGIVRTKDNENLVLPVWFIAGPAFEQGDGEQGDDPGLFSSEDH